MMLLVRKSCRPWAYWACWCRPGCGSRGGGAGGLCSDDDEVTYRLFVRLCDLLGVGPSGARAIWQNMPARKGLCLIAKICKYCEQ